MHPNITIMTRAARKAGEIILRGMSRLERLEVQEKHPNDFVTEVDVQAEQSIIEIIQSAYPEDSFLTEEAGEIWGNDRDTIWVIDPLDGTLNFMHGFSHFSVSIAKKVKGRIEQAVIFNPVSQELYTATRGEGARLNERRIRVSPRVQMHGTLIATNLPRLDDQEQVYQKLLDRTLPHIGALRRTGSTALDLSYVAAGFVDAFVCVGCQEWDVAAGLLLVREAGGLIADLTGSEDFLRHHHLIAANPKLAKQLLGELNS